MLPPHLVNLSTHHSHFISVSSLIKRYTEWPYYKSHSMIVHICCGTEEKMLRQNAFAYDKWLVSADSACHCQSSSQNIGLIRWNNFLNLWTFGEVMGNITVACFLTHSVHVPIVLLYGTPKVPHCLPPESHNRSNKHRTHSLWGFTALCFPWLPHSCRSRRLWQLHGFVCLRTGVSNPCSMTQLLYHRIYYFENYM